MFSNFIHVLSYLRISFLFEAEYCSLIFIYHILLSTVSGYFGCFRLCNLWLMLLWAMVYKYLLKSLPSVILGLYPGMELLNHIVILCITLGGTATLFFTVIAPFYIAISHARGFQFLYMLTKTCYFQVSVVFILIIALNGCELVSHCGFNLHFPNDW